ncbi:hypothetical protein BsWGS_22951 [Bradybaena similaris]
MHPPGSGRWQLALDRQPSMCRDQHVFIINRRFLTFSSRFPLLVTGILDKIQLYTPVALNFPRAVVKTP